jgi:hypothetical protein
VAILKAVLKGIADSLMGEIDDIIADLSHFCEL